MSKSGNIYRVKLEFDLGYTFVELIDFSLISEFNGILVQCLDIFTNKKTDISEHDFESSKVLYGPVPINDFPKIKGKYAWEYICRIDKLYDPASFVFKKLKGMMIMQDYNWGKLSSWYKVYPFVEHEDSKEYHYEDVRLLETLYINHRDSIITRLTMLRLLMVEKPVTSFFDLGNEVNLIIYLKLINTYCSKEKTESLIKAIG